MKNPMEDFLDKYPPPAEPDGERESAVQTIRPVRPERRPIDDTIDLHGLTVEEATQRLDSFIKASVSAGYGKVLIVHGKGSTPESIAPLRRLVQRYLEQNPHVGSTGFADVKDGGRGATWAIIR